MALGVLLLIWGAISFHNLPVEAYPDVANNWVQVITQWPGRAAEEVEQQITIPIETQMNGIAHLTSLRSISIFGLSTVTLIFDDQSEDLINRQQALEKLSQVTLPANVNPVLGADYSPVGQIYFFTLKSNNPEYDLMQLKSIEDWVVEKQLKSVPNVVDVVSVHHYADALSLRQRLDGLKSGTSKPILVEEVGYSTFGVDEAQQASLLHDAINVAESDGAAGWLVWTAFDFSADTTCTPPNCPDPESGEHHFGLWHIDGSPKLAVATIKALTGY